MDDTTISDPAMPDPATRVPAAAGSAATHVRGDDRGAEVAARLTRWLAAFGGASVLGGAALALAATHPTVRAYGQQTAGWGAINLVIAGIGAARAGAHPARATSLRRTLLASAALDVGTIAFGAHMAVHRTTFGGRQSPQAALGNGLAVVDQALGLLALDLIHARALRP